MAERWSSSKSELELRVELSDEGRVQSDFLSELATKPTVTRSTRRRPRLDPCRSIGRPAGSRKHGAFRNLVLLLLSAVDELGGALTFSEEYPEAGTLWPAVRVFGPLLPPGVVPANVPASRLRRAYEVWQKTCRAGTP
jgi:hypothetical protein